jgi:hypothetical protein
MIWKDKWDMSILANVHKLPAEGNYCHKCVIAHRLATAENCHWQINYVHRGDRIANGYSVREHGSR